MKLINPISCFLLFLGFIHVGHAQMRPTNGVAPSEMKKIALTVQGNTISQISFLKEDYISLTDIARIKNPAEPKDVVKNWLRSRSTIEFLGGYEKSYPPLRPDL
jgi:hypothetical protein